jgi:hypothetical protein
VVCRARDLLLVCRAREWVMMYRGMGGLQSKGMCGVQS